MRLKGYLAVILTLALVLSGCSGAEKTDSSPVVVTVWHAYNEYAKKVFDKKVMEFNETVGKEKGIVVDAYGFGSNDELDDSLFNSANKMIGSEPLPTVFSAYPGSACRLDNLAPLVDLRRYFDDDELAGYRPEFLQEGEWGNDDEVRMLPVAKSTELLYLNRTDWDEFSAATGVSKEALATWEGLKETAERYFEWSGGRPFLGMNSYNDFSILTAAQLGVEPYREEDGKLSVCYPEEAARKVWEAYYVPHIMGWYKSRVYNQDGIKSGALIAYIGSSAGAAFFPTEVIADEKSSYPIDCEVFSYPYFRDGEDYLTQRGANMSIFSSDPAHEKAGAEFLKWFTDPNQNIEFTVSIGYIPVETKALTSTQELLKYVQESENRDAVKKSASAALSAMEERKFYIRKTYENAYDADEIYRMSLAERTALDLEEIQLRVTHGEDRTAVTQEYLSDENFKDWYNSLVKEMTDKLNEQENKK